MDNGQSKSIWQISQSASDECKVQKDDELKSSSNEWNERMTKMKIRKTSHCVSDKINVMESMNLDENIALCQKWKFGSNINK